jgi:hypothetical protein
MLRSVLVPALLLSLLAFEAAAFALPRPLAAVFVGYCLWLLFVRKQRAELATVLVLLLVAFLGVEVFVRLNADAIFYREHEKWALAGRYKADVDDTVPVRFGDLVAMDPARREALAEPRRLTFVTDGDGFRNRADHAQQPYVILGDSFATTVGSSQEDILVEQLERALPGTFSSRAYPGTPNEYENTALRFLEEHPEGARFLWFVFEGNDFEIPNGKESKPRPPSRLDVWRARLDPLALPFMATRVLKILGKVAEAQVDKALGKSRPTQVSVATVGGRELGFFDEYVARTREPKLAISIVGSPEVLERTACVFFIPDKHRVYHPWLEDAAPIPEPAAGFVGLAEYFGARGIRVVDLTPALRRAAASALERGRFVYWRDDTHWNGEGIAGVVDEVKACVAQDRAARGAPGG